MQHDSPVKSDALLKRGLMIEYSSLAWMTVEAIGAIVAGIFSGSLALLAFGGDSIIELASSIAVLGHLKEEKSGRGSENHAEKTEQATVILLFLLVPVIGLGTTYAYLTGVEPESSILGILIAAGAVVIMQFSGLKSVDLERRLIASPWRWMLQNQLLVFRCRLRYS